MQAATRSHHCPPATIVSHRPAPISDNGAIPVEMRWACPAFVHILSEMAVHDVHRCDLEERYIESIENSTSPSEKGEEQNPIPLSCNVCEGSDADPR